MVLLEDRLEHDQSFFDQLIDPNSMMLLERAAHVGQIVIDNSHHALNLDSDDIYAAPGVFRQSILSEQLRVAEHRVQRRP